MWDEITFHFPNLKGAALVGMWLFVNVVIKLIKSGKGRPGNIAPFILLLQSQLPTNI